MKFLLPVVCLLIYLQTEAQTQSCPINSNFSTGTLTHWWAYTGNNKGGNPAQIRLNYDSGLAAPTGTIGAVSIPEYNLPGVTGIRVISGSTQDTYGGFATIPNINGFQYTNSVLLGSTSISRSGSGGTQGGYVRGVSYQISVPVSPATQPYTMTYAYAMVLENGSHNSNQQPLFSATLTTSDSVITCASPKYYLPTSDNANNQGTGATLDTAIAISQGFSLSLLPSPNPDPNNNSPNAPHLRDVWTKGWTEVTFDLSPYRGQQVTLTFEADNCVPGGHFAYAYVALRNTCEGLIISGPLQACIGKNLTYSIPALASANYDWTVPPGWTIVSGANTNILTVNVGTGGPGKITAHGVNGCADLKDTIDVTTALPTIAGSVGNDNEVCTGSNSNVLTATGYRGSILSWLSSTNGINYTQIPNTASDQYTATNLTSTSIYAVLVQNGSSCDVDTSSIATILVDPKSVGGQINPTNMEVCREQDKDAILTLTGRTGSVVNWQSSTDNINWNDINPADTTGVYSIVDLVNATQFRAIVKSGVCPADTSTIASVVVLPGLFPEATYSPADTSICYGTTAQLNAVITRGTNYTWNNSTTLTNTGDGNIASTPYTINATAAPKDTTSYVLSILNTGCPNPLKDTFVVNVIAPILVDAGHDTSVVINQPLQLNAISNNNTVVFSWTPATGLNNPSIPNPIGIYGIGIDSVRYIVKATTPAGCFGEADILVKVFSTDPDIFVPNAFTPGKTSNSVFRPIAPGIASLQFFRVYNRWGQLVYSTSTIGQGWDGRVNGKLQDPGTYVWMVQGISYVGKPVFRKGTVILIR